MHLLPLDRVYTCLERSVAVHGTGVSHYQASLEPWWKSGMEEEWREEDVERHGLR